MPGLFGPQLLAAVGQTAIRDVNWAQARLFFDRRDLLLKRLRQSTS